MMKKLSSLLFLVIATVIITGSCDKEDPQGGNNEDQINTPTVTTGEVTNIESTTATCSGNVKADGGATVTARGVCWSTAENPTTSDSKTTDGTGKGTYTSNLTELSPNTQYYARAYATNSKGTAYGEQRAFKTQELDICTKVTDVVFRRYLIENYDYNGDGKVTTDEAKMITKIEIAGEGITSFAGIEYIPNLREFVCNFNKVKTLNLSKNIELTTLECNFCELTALDLSENTHLKNLECYSNNLTSLDLSNNVDLTDVSCHGNKIKILDFTKNTKLTSILCSGSNVESVTIKGLSKLERFTCTEGSLATLDLTGCTALTSLTLYDNKLTSLDITPCIKLNHLVCQNNRIVSLDLTNGDFPNCPSYLVPLKCNNMATLKTVYVKTGWRLKYITYDRSTSYIPATTEIIYK